MRKAVFPVAGLGTRFLPATKASPKEMLPIVDKPLIQYAVEEAASAGITEMIFITGRSKRAIEDHFDKAYELEAELEAKGKKELLQLVRSVAPSSINCIYIRQPEALGLGHADVVHRYHRRRFHKEVGNLVIHNLLNVYSRIGHIDLNPTHVRVTGPSQIV